MPKPLIWIGSSRKDLRKLPDDVKDELGRALLDVQYGDTPRCAKALSGFGGASIMEIVEDSDGSTYRAVYTAKFGDVVYVLHAFQKKSHTGIKTPEHEIDLVKSRLKLAEDHYAKSRGSY